MSSNETAGSENVPDRGIKPLDEQSVWRLGDGALRVLVIDNYDSFTYNLVQTFIRYDVALEVVRNDHFTVAECCEYLAAHADCVVLSPGPGRPEQAGICVELLQAELAVPMFGVCLGHQALSLACGGEVDAAPQLMHGKTSLVRYQEHPMFAGLENPFVATRYHSLRVPEASLPEDLVPLAWSEDGVLQAMAHRRLPYWGVQFHPESILTTSGPRLLHNFVRFAAAQAGVALAPLPDAESLASGKDAESEQPEPGLGASPEAGLVAERA
jgi:anthranilate synthase/aminodeoxychorismate synthase-like glutamine amidotransferase